MHYEKNKKSQKSLEIHFLVVQLVNGIKTYVFNLNILFFLFLLYQFIVYNYFNYHE